jgi:hypothetical protein
MITGSVPRHNIWAVTAFPLIGQKYMFALLRFSQDSILKKGERKPMMGSGFPVPNNHWLFLNVRIATKL